MEFIGEANFDEDLKVQSIIRWMTKDASFKGNTDPNFVSLFLKRCDYDEEEAKDWIENFYKYRNSYPKIMTKRDYLDKVCHLMYDRGGVTCDLNNENYRFPIVVVLQFKRLLPEDDMYDAARLLITGFESGLRESKRVQQYGGIGIFDLQDMGISMAIKFTPTFLKQIILCGLNGVPVKMKEFHVINVGVITATVVKIAIFLLPEKIRKMLYIHSQSHECLSDYIPPEHLPVELGGTNGTIDENNEYFRPTLAKWRDYLLEDEKFGF